MTIPYVVGDMPGYLFLVDDSGKPRPTVIYTNGFDSTREEGYNFLAYDGVWVNGLQNLAEYVCSTTDYTQTVDDIHNIQTGGAGR